MATNVFPALHVNPPQAPPQENLLDSYSHLLQLKNTLQLAPLEMQQRQQAIQSSQLGIQQQQQDLKDQQGVANWYKNFDPSDLNATDPVAVGRALANQGVSGAGIMKVQQGILQQRQTLATLTKDQLANQQTVADNVSNGINGIIGETDPTKRAAAITPLVQTAAQNKLIDPQKAQQILQNPGAVTDDQLKQFQHGLGVSAAFTKSAAAQQQAQYKMVNGTLYDVSGAQPKPAIAAQMDPTQWNAAVDSIAPPTGTTAALNQRTHAMVNFYVSQGNTEAAQKALTDASSQIGTVEKETNPLVQQGKVDVATAEGQARANIDAQVARGSSAALAQVPPHLVAPATSAATKAGEDYAQANSVSQRIAEMMNDARNGNVVSYQLIPQEGALQLTTSQGVKRINMAEIQNYGGGSLFQQLQGHFGKALTGQSIPPSVLNDMAQIQDVMARGAQTKYTNDLNTINQTYGANFQPVQMGAMPKAGSAPNGAPAPKEGTTKVNSHGDKVVFKGGAWQLQ